MMEKKDVRILLAEDEALTALSIKDFLTRQGFEVMEPVSTALKAIEAAQTLKPTIIFMDIRLAGKMDGIEAAAAIRKISPIPIAFMSGYSNKETIERAYKTFPVAFLIKPLILQKLLDTIERYASK
jgi:CheY-like chemotaxis protein